MIEHFAHWVMIFAPVMPSFASCALILLIVASLQPTILIVLREVLQENIEPMSETFLVSQLLKSKVVNELQNPNIEYISAYNLFRKFNCLFIPIAHQPLWMSFFFGFLMWIAIFKMDVSFS